MDFTAWTRLRAITTRLRGTIHPFPESTNVQKGGAQPVYVSTTFHDFLLGKKLGPDDWAPGRVQEHCGLRQVRLRLRGMSHPSGAVER